LTVTSFIAPKHSSEAVTNRLVSACLPVLASLLCQTSAAHEYAGPHGTVIVDWKAPKVSRITSSGYGDSFGIEAAVKMGFPEAETVDGKNCIGGSYFLFDVADDYAFDIDEKVEIEILFDRRRSNGFWFSYDRNALSEPAEAIEFGKSGEHWYAHTIELERARFANRGEAGSDFALAGISAMWPGIPDENHRIVICDLKITRSGETTTPTDFGELKLRVGSDASGPTPVRVGIYDASGRMPLPSDDALTIRNYDDSPKQIFLRATHGTESPWPHDNRHIFYIDGAYGARLPVGKYQLIISKGPEYEVAQQDVIIENGETVEVDIGLRRWTNMPAAGWYSGDDHVHMFRQTSDNGPISQVMQAEDVHVTNVLQMGNPVNMHFHQYAFGEGGRYLDGHHALVPGVEDPRTALRGHTISLNIGEVVRNPELYLRYEQIFDTYGKQGGLSGYAHVAGELFNVGRGLALDVPLGAVDFVEVMQDGILATELWYDFLNLGFRLTPTAGSDFPYLGYPGSERNYVYLGDTFSIDAWYEQLKAGRTFVTNGPMLKLDVNGRPMGTTIDLHAGEKIEIRASASLNPDLESLDRLELVVHGKIVATANDVSVGNSLLLEHSLVLRDGMWIAARAYGTDQASAHSSPVYVVTDEGGFRNADAVEKIADAMLARLDEFDALRVDAGSELEVWSVAKPLEAMLVKQRRHILQRVDEARKVYASLVDRPKTPDHP
jgi:hypothetical protein